MVWIARVLLAAGVLLLVVVVAFVAGALLSLDWARQHTARTAALPRLSPDRPEGVVRIDANGMTFRARVAGMDNRGPGVVLLHGFPETSAMWIPLLRAAAEAGYRVVAFDQRGYSPGARPSGVAPYQVPALVNDVLAVADAVGFERFHLVGHDWGCVVGWGVAIRRPERLRSWTGLSVPHPGALVEVLRGQRPAYIKVFTAPWLPELLLSFNRMALVRRNAYDLMPEAQREEYLAVFLEPGALTATLNWYRAITTSLDAGEEIVRPVETPTLFIWGGREGWVSDEALARQRELVTGEYRELELDGGHWLIERATEPVVEAVLRHIERSDSPSPKM